MTELPKKQQPPKHIGKAGTAWWRTVIEGRTPDATDYTIMVLAAECLDASAAARVAIEKEGATIPTKHSFKLNPMVDVMARNKLIFIRLVRQLGIQPLEES